MSIGFRVFLRRELPPQHLVEAYKNMAAADVADCMQRVNAMHSRIRLVTRPFTGSMAGAALTVKTRSGDNLMLHMALNIAKEGDVIVVSNEEGWTRSLMGEVMATVAVHKKLSGIVLDGPVRDIEALYDTGIPVYATGTTAGGSYKEGPGEVNVPIVCANVPVNPGDIVLGDRDGVVVVPRADAAGLYEKVKDLRAHDQNKVVEAREGRAKREWVEATLAAKGCTFIDDVFH